MSVRVSVCIPTLNQASFIQERLSSISAQTLRDWEIVACDSYSDDGTWEVIQRVADADERVKAFRVPREGIYAGWNECLRRARGEFVHIATADDVSRPGFLEKLILAIETVPGCIAAHCAFDQVDQSGAPFTRSLGTVSKRILGAALLRDHFRHPRTEFLLNLLAAPAWVCFNTLVFRREVLEKIGYFPLNRGAMGDCEWAMRLGLCGSVAFISEPLAIRRRHDAQRGVIEARKRPAHERLSLRATMAEAVLRDHAERVRSLFGLSEDRVRWFLEPIEELAKIRRASPLEKMFANLLKKKRGAFPGVIRFGLPGSRGRAPEGTGTHPLVEHFHRMRKELDCPWPPTDLPAPQVARNAQ